MVEKRELPLRRVRKSRTLTQEQFAALLGISQDSVSSYELGLRAVPRDLQEQMSTILGVPRLDLFPESETVMS